jgi:hypothetical protein
VVDAQRCHVPESCQAGSERSCHGEIDSARVAMEPESVPVFPHHRGFAPRPHPGGSGGGA